MVKLIRLTTENDNQFEADMDSDLKLGPKASVALQNLTFETEFSTLGISGAERSVTYNFNTNVYAAAHTNEMKVAEYTSANYPDMFDDLAGALNDTCSIGDTTNFGQPGDTTQMNNYMQFNVTGSEEKKAIQLRVTPMLHPLLKTRAFDYRFEAADVRSDYARSALLFTSQPAGYWDQTGADGIPPPVDTTPGVWLREVGGAGGDGSAPEPLEYGIVSRESAGAGSALNRYIHPADGVEWSKGSAVWWTRINNLIDNGAGKETNGFAIGLSKTPIPGAEVLASTHQDYEIRCYKPTDNVTYITPDDGNAHQDGGVPPAQTTSAEVDNHDIMMLRKDRNVVRGFLISRDGSGGAIRHQLFAYTIPEADRNKPLYPYAYINGAFAHASMSQPSLTLDPFAISRLEADAYRALMTPQIGDMYGFDGGQQLGDQLESGFERSSAAMQTKLPDLIPHIYEEVPLPGQITTVTINKSILRFLGFSGPDYIGAGTHTFNPRFNAGAFAGTFGFEIIPETVFDIANSDNYVVILDSHPLQSYDASSSQGLLLNDVEASKIGRRLNILATIPVSDNSGIVEQEVNELVYIDLDNEYPQSITNLRLRVLDKSLSKVKTTGESVMTLLFKDN